MILFFHGFVHFTYTTVIIEIYRNRKSKIIEIILKTILGLLKNIVLFGMIIGITLNYSQVDMPIHRGKNTNICNFIPLILVSLELH